ncbi:MAG: VWA domain-containing protein [Planctomycetota bacterium]
MFLFLTSFFSHPALLAGAAAGAIPVIIHLLNRRHFKRIIWAAMHWLWASYKKSRRRLQIEQLILLLIRVLILVLLAFMLARPALQEGAGAITGRASVHRIIVLDNSYSMGQQVGGKPLFEKARERAIELINNLSPSDEADVILANSITEEITVNCVASKPEVIGLLRAATLSDGGTDIPHAIAAACAVINKRKSRNSRKEIIIITDQTRAGWEQGHQPRRIGSEDEAAIQKAFSDHSRPMIMVLRLPGERYHDNLAAVKVEVDEKIILARAETQFFGTIANFSTAPRTTRVKFKINGEEIATETINNLAVRRLETVTFRHTFPVADSYVVSIELEADSLPADNAAYLAVDVENQMRVLCVDGEQRIEPQASELDYFRQALSPTKSEELHAGGMPLCPEVISDAMFPEANLDNYRLVVLGNVALIPPEKIQALEQFVNNGGVLWIFVGGRVDPVIYNKDMANLLPMNLGELIGTEDPNGPSDSISNQDASHPAIQKFQGIKGWSLSHLRTFRRYKLTPRPQSAQANLSDTRTLLVYENGEPAAAERFIGAANGRVVLFGTTADKAWNNWPLTNRYMPLMNFIALDLIQPSYIQRNRLVGERFVMQIPRHDLGAARREGIRLIAPFGEASAMEILTEQSRIESGLIRKAGSYTAHLPGDIPRTVHFAANRNIEESDLSPIEDREILSFIPRVAERLELSGYFKSLITQADFELVADEIKDVEEKLKKHSGSREIWRWLAGAVLMLLLVESFLARRFGDFTR